MPDPHDTALVQLITKAINNGLSDYEDGEIIEAGNYFERAQVYLAGFQARIKMEIKRELDAGGDPGELG